MGLPKKLVPSEVYALCIFMFKYGWERKAGQVSLSERVSSPVVQGSSSLCVSFLCLGEEI